MDDKYHKHTTRACRGIVSQVAEPAQSASGFVNNNALRSFYSGRYLTLDRVPC